MRPAETERALIATVELEAMMETSATVASLVAEVNGSARLAIDMPLTKAGAASAPATERGPYPIVGFSGKTSNRLLQFF
jgi:hypothetical protein